MTRYIDSFNKIMHRAYLRDGRITYNDEAMMLACLVHSRGNSRDGEEMIDVQKIMRDINIDSSKRSSDSKMTEGHSAERSRDSRRPRDSIKT